MNWFLAENRILRFASFAIFYISQGLPIGLLTIALPAWLSEEGVLASDIAYFVAISGLPWAFKLLAGPIMDRFAFLPMGRRRPWVVGAQVGLLMAMMGLAFVPDPVNNIVILTWMAFAVNFFSAFQDVAVDGMAIDVLPEDERGRANSFMAFGQVSGYAASGALSALMLVNFGLMGASLGLFGLLVLIFVWGMITRERRGERIFPWSQGAALERSINLQADSWVAIAKNLQLVLFLKASVILILVTLCWRLTNAFWLIGAPVTVTQTLGFASTDYSYWASTFSVIAAVLGLLLGPVIDRSGAKRILMLSMILFGIFYFGLSFSVDYLSNPLVLLSAGAIEALLSQAVFISFISIHMSICWQRVSATQFAIYMAWANLGRTIGVTLYGKIEPMLDVNQELLLMSAIAVLGAVILTFLKLEANVEKLKELNQVSVKI